MLLVEDTLIPTSALPVSDFRDHLRLGTGFGDETLQDGLLERQLRAAVAAIEARTGKILIARTFTWTLANWQDGQVQALPVAPVDAVTSLTLVSRDGQETVVDTAAWNLVPDAHRPALSTSATALPAVPTNGRARIGFRAGFGPDWADVPPDIAQATLLLAAHFYEYRHSAEGRGVDIPADVATMIAPHRRMRIHLGGRSA
ncbi:MAG: hypothetical protein AAFP98_10570 [Pseudomonadota bacterium]